MRFLNNLSPLLLPLIVRIYTRVLRIAHTTNDARDFTAGTTSSSTYLERGAELERHDVVQDRIDCGGHVVEDAGHVRGDAVQLVQERYVVGVRVSGRCVVGPEYGDQSLRVERRPADEERHDDGHCNVETRLTGGGRSWSVHGETGGRGKGGGGERRSSEFRRWKCRRDRCAFPLFF